MSALDPILLPTYLASVIGRYAMDSSRLKYAIIKNHVEKNLSLNENILFLFYIKKNKIIK